MERQVRGSFPLGLPFHFHGRTEIVADNNKPNNAIRMVCYINFTNRDEYNRSDSIGVESCTLTCLRLLFTFFWLSPHPPTSLLPSFPPSFLPFSSFHHPLPTPSSSFSLIVPSSSILHLFPSRL